MRNYEAEVNGVTHTFQLDADDAKRAEEAGVKLKAVSSPRSAADPDAVSEVDQLRAENAALKAALTQGSTAGDAPSTSGDAAGDTSGDSANKSRSSRTK